MSNFLEKGKKLIRKKLCRPTVPNFLAMLVETKNIFTPNAMKVCGISFTQYPYAFTFVGKRF